MELTKKDCIAIKCHNTPGDNDSWTYEINLPYYVEGIPEEWLVWKDILLLALNGKGISRITQRYIFTDRLWMTYAKATFNQATLDIGIGTVVNFNKVLAEMTKHVFSPYAFREQKRYLCRHLIKPRWMKLRNFISRLQELNAYFPSDTEGQETTPPPYGYHLHSMLTTWKNKLI